MERFWSSFVVEPEHWELCSGTSDGHFSVENGPFVNVLVTQSAMGNRTYRSVWYRMRSFPFNIEAVLECAPRFSYPAHFPTHRTEQDRDR